MNCRECGQMLPEYLDGGADENMTAALESHALTCSRCHALLSAHRLLLTGLSDTEPVPAPPGFEDRLFAAVKSAELRRSGEYVFAFRLAAVLAIAGGAAALVLHVLTGSIMTAVSGFIASFISMFGADSVSMGNPAVMENVRAWLMEYAGRSFAAFMSLFTPVAIPTTSLAIAPIYPLGTLILVIQLWWYLSFPQTGISIHVSKRSP